MMEIMHVKGLPKSGTTWLEELLKELMKEAAAKSGVAAPEGTSSGTGRITAEEREALEERVLDMKVGGSWLGVVPMFTLGQLALSNFDIRLEPRRREVTLRSKHSLEFSRSAPVGCDNHTYIVIFRNPLDVTVSSYHFYGEKGKETPLAEYAARELPKKLEDMVTLHRSAAELPNCVTVSYEGLHVDPTGELRRIIAAVPALATACAAMDQAALERVVAASSADSMRAKEASREMELPVRLLKMEHVPHELRLVRTAKAYGFVTSLPAELVPKLLQETKRTIPAELYKLVLGGFAASKHHHPFRAAPWRALCAAAAAALTLIATGRGVLPKR
mmetsp:Transcript_28257/g.92226  ORF Transcript_28257/g.92226 Transcript_28257/m.92226 type:complete len:332 (-) Transcript_28257:1161-2156(-)